MKAKKIVSLVLAMMLVFALALPSFAIVSGNQPTYPNGASYYVQANNSDYYVNGQITVHLHVVTYKYPVNTFVDRVYNVTVGTANATNQLITVADVLTKLEQDNVGIGFSILYPNNQYLLNGVHDTLNQANDWYYGAILYKGSTAHACNYMFRINGMLPYYYPSGSTTPIGCLISDAYVTDGDTIDLYYANAYKQNLATGVEFIRQVSNKTFQILYSKCYYTNPNNSNDWNPTAWTLPYVSEYVDIFVDGVSITVYVDGNGQFTLNSLSTGTHSFMTDSMLFTQFSTTPNGSTKYYVPLCATMYSEYAVS